ncbi:sensor histidine kinase [Streptomyces sp. SID8379]|uniref:sensor histidine kinase n=1 Tax=unclassified Streptomyces TaxID=2593676 RepID=UPI00035CE5E6|nr:MULTISPECIES: sensor histidine kinase [unclassified Streptomyces]MYW68851.1 sensor histidine kinase [Streptomyces sp. SID8379]
MTGTWTAARARARRAATARDLPLLAAAVLALAALAEVTGQGRGPEPELPGLLALALGATAPLAFVRSQLLLTATALTAAALLAPLAYGRTLYAGLPALAAALYLVGRRGPGRTAVLFAVPFTTYALTDDSGPYGVVLLAGAAAALTAGGARRAKAEAARRSAADWAYADTALAHAALGERARIARELHDIVAHHISTISVQAETARYTTPGLPPEGAERFLAIGDTARLALTEMRRLLGVLREDAPAEPAAAAPRSPQPGLDQLVTLVDEARAATGTAVRLIVRGRVTALDPGLELTAYRIVQEALTNARRHAPGVAVDVELHYRESQLAIRVRDCGPGTGAGEPGHGLLGMRERTAMAGGTLHAGQAPAGGFLVEAVLPVRSAAR